MNRVKKVSMVGVLIGSLLMTAGVGRGQTPQDWPTKPFQSASQGKQVYYCGALTKKGTPCKHRVKHQGDRCWQHKGVAK